MNNGNKSANETVEVPSTAAPPTANGDFTSPGAKSGRDTRGGADRSDIHGMKDDVKHALEHEGDELKGRSAKALNSLAHTLRSASQDGELDPPPFLRNVIDHAAEGLEAAAGHLERSTAGDMLEAARDFGRSNPVALVGGSVLLGFALARFVGSSKPDGRSAYDGDRRRTAANASTSADMSEEARNEQR